MGLPVICAGSVHYEIVKGTWKLTSASELPGLLDRLLADPQAPPRAQTLMQRYLYLWFFRIPQAVEVLNPDYATCNSQPRFRRGEELSQGLNPHLDQICDYVRGVRPRVEPPPTWRPRDGQLQAGRGLQNAEPCLALVSRFSDLPSMARTWLIKLLAQPGKARLLVLVSGGQPEQAKAVIETVLTDLAPSERWPVVKVMAAGLPREALTQVVASVAALVVGPDAATWELEWLADELGLTILSPDEDLPQCMLGMLAQMDA